MEKKMFKVTYNNVDVRQFEEGTTFREISEQYKHDFAYDILVAKVDNDICDLSDELHKNCTIQFFDRSSETGNTVYFSSACFMLILATKNVVGDEARVVIQHSLDKGIYCVIKNAIINKSILKQIEAEMHRICEEDYLFDKMSVSRMDAMKYFKKRKKLDKVNVLKYISNTYVNLYRLDSMYDYYYGKMAYSTKQIPDFKLNYIGDNGLVLSAPDLINPECTLDYVHHPLIHETFKANYKFGQSIGIINAADLNKVVSQARIGDLIRISEAFYDNQLMEVANEISRVPGKYKLILLTGPTSSGKTTTANKLKTYIQSKGINVYTLSTDDYFLNKEDTPKLENGEYDFESINAVDVELFNKHLMSLLAGERVQIPTYNFILGKREYHDKSIKLQNDDVIIVEGIHALNDVLTMSIDRSDKYKIYISPLTHLNIDGHNYIHTSDLRKLRRIIRDSKHRGYGASDTLKRWPEIERNEEINIYPHQDEVNVILNSSLEYEIGVLKTYVEPLLFCVEEDDPVYPEALRLINFLRNFLPIPSDEVPKNSVLREFIGGSCYKD